MTMVSFEGCLIQAGDLIELMDRVNGMSEVIMTPSIPETKGQVLLSDVGEREGAGMEESRSCLFLLMIGQQELVLYGEKTSLAVFTG